MSDNHHSLATDPVAKPDPLALPIEDLDLTVRAYNCLAREGVRTVGQLIAFSEQDLRYVPNFGAQSIPEVKLKLSGLGLTLKDSDKTCIHCASTFPTIYELSVHQIECRTVDPDHLPVPRRIHTALMREGVTTVNRLVELSEDDLYDIRNIGQVSIEDIKSKLAKRGLSLGKPIPAVIPGRIVAEHDPRHQQALGFDVRLRNRYVAGATLAKLATVYNLSPERVRGRIRRVDPDAFSARRATSGRRRLDKSAGDPPKAPVYIRIGAQQEYLVGWFEPTAGDIRRELAKFLRTVAKSIDAQVRSEH